MLECLSYDLCEWSCFVSSDGITQRQCAFTARKLSIIIIEFIDNNPSTVNKYQYYELLSIRCTIQLLIPLESSVSSYFSRQLYTVCSKNVQSTLGHRLALVCVILPHMNTFPASPWYLSIEWKELDSTSFYWSSIK